MLPAQNGVPSVQTKLSNVLVSPDLSRLAMGSPLVSFGSAPADALYMFGPGDSVTWLSAPTIADPLPGTPYLDGASSDFSSLYFNDEGTLLPSDDAANPAFGGASRSSVISSGASGSAQDLGFYEWTASHGLTYAGVLPDGSVDPYGAAPAELVAGGDGRGFENPTFFASHDVSSDASRALFVSPAPGSNAPASDPIELYDRETLPDGSQRTVLVSASAVTGQPAPDGPLPVPGLLPGSGTCPFPPNPSSSCPSPYAFASPDGSHVFFESTDALTSGSPTDGSVKEYEFDTDTNTLSYLQGVADQQPDPSQQLTYYSPIVVSTVDGSEFMFVKEAAAGDSLDLWSGGAIRPVAQFPEDSTQPGAGLGSLASGIPEGRVSSDGSVFVFETSSPIYTTAPGEFNNAEGFEQIYRYDTLTGVMSCLSCGPAGMQHSGDANMSNDYSTPFEMLSDSRGISSDGQRVFFDSPDPLLPQATNGLRNVYEWEADGDGSCASSADAGGCLYLISSGQGSGNDYFLDNSANGNDVFFATTQGLVAQDTDGAYDIYDARVDGGFAPASVSTPCSGDTCQGAVTSAPSLPSAATVAFSGPGNATSTPTKVLTTGKIKVTTRAARGPRFAVMVKVPGSGRIVLASTSVKTVRKAVPKAGTYRLTVSLTPKSKKKLRRKRELKVALSVRYAPISGRASSARVSIAVKA